MPKLDVGIQNCGMKMSFGLFVTTVEGRALGCGEGLRGDWSAHAILSGLLNSTREVLLASWPMDHSNWGVVNAEYCISWQVG